MNREDSIVVVRSGSKRAHDGSLTTPVELLPVEDVPAALAAVEGNPAYVVGRDAANGDLRAAIQAGIDGAAIDRDRTDERVHDVTAVLREVNRSLVRAETHEAIERAVCRQLIDSGTYTVSALGVIEADAFQIRAAAGPETVRPPPSVFGPGVQIVPADGTTLGADHRLATVPVSNDGVHYGFLVLGTDDDAAFGGTEREILADLGSTTAHAIDAVEIQRELRRKNERFEHVTRVLSHDLRNPLQVAIGVTDAIAGQCEDGRIDRLEQALDRITELLDDILAITREDTVTLNRSQIDLSRVARAAWQTVDTGAGTLDVADEPTVVADETRLRQVLENLFRNAIEHGPPGVCVRVGETDRGFFVADDGPGIDPADRERVFDLEYSGSESGTGLGLAIVAEIVEAHGWEIEISTSQSGGARFDIHTTAAPPGHSR
ncbi:MAG: ATP-binding protein [Halococcoides sp.]